eukprot:COSAG01_NODE_2448_length_7682_cov_10.409600_4_plen_43_part_00
MPAVRPLHGATEPAALRVGQFGPSQYNYTSIAQITMVIVDAV